MKRYLKPATLVAALTLLLALVAGCGESAETAQKVETVTVTERIVREEPSEPRPATEETAPEEPATEEDAATEEPSSAGRIRVPNVVGKDHQLAQDTMQAAGLYNLAEEDATGQGRVLLVDRNWTTVAQSPKAGSMVNEDQTIVLRAKKDGE